MKLATSICVAAALASSAVMAQDFNPAVEIAVLTDYSSVYKDNTGEGSFVGAQMAIDDFMKNHPDTTLRPTVVRLDHSNKTDLGLSMAREFYDKGGDLLLGTANSAIALGAANLAKEDNKVVIIISAGSTDIHGKGCTPNSMHWGFDSYASVGAVRALVQEEGLDSWFFITADYTYGHNLQAQAAQFVEKNGGKVVGEVQYPLGASDFSSYVLSAQSSGANAIGLANGGNDFSNALKQAAEFGVTQTQAVVGMYVEITNLRSLGPDVAGGLRFAQPFYWDATEGSRSWTKRFIERRGGIYPTSNHASAYSAVINYLNTLNEVKTEDGAKLVAEMKMRPTNDEPYGEGRIREDGRRLIPMYLLQAKTADEVTSEWDVAKVIATIPADKAWKPMEEGGCPLVADN